MDEEGERGGIMWKWKSPVIILSRVGFIIGAYLSIASAVDIYRPTDDPDTRRPFGLYLGLAKAIGSGSCNEDSPSPDTGKGWGKTNSTSPGGMNSEDSIGMEIAHRPGGVSNLSEEEKANLYDRLGREMHLLEDTLHSSPDSLSLSPLSDQLSGK
jgi:hypothetical protein